MRCGDKKAGSLTFSILSDNWYVIVLPPVEEESVAARRKSRAGGCKKFPPELAFCWRQHSEVSMMVAEVPLSRPCPPRPGDYVVVPGSQGPRRDLRISVCLRDCWDAEGRVFDVSETVRALLAP
jgi:hypothetical protein